MALSKEQVEKIISRVSSGERVTHVLKSDTENGFIWNMAELHAVLKNDPTLQSAYNFARELLCDCMADEIIEIADDIDESPMSRKVRTDNRRWYTGKLFPSRYGERLDLNITQLPSLKSALETAEKRRKALIDDSAAKQVTVISRKINKRTGDYESHGADFGDVDDAIVVPDEKDIDIFS